MQFNQAKSGSIPNYEGIRYKLLTRLACKEKWMEFSTLCTTLAEGTCMCTLGWEVCCKSHVLYACVWQICLRGKAEYIVQKCITNFSSSTQININHVALERHLGSKLFLKVCFWSPLPKTIRSTSMESLQNSKILCYFTDCVMTAHSCFSLCTVPSRKSSTVVGHKL